MDLLSILLKVFGLVLIVVFIILGIKLIYLTNEATKVVTEVEKEIENYKNRFSPVFKLVDYFGDIADRSNFLVRKIFKKFKSRNEE